MPEWGRVITLCSNPGGLSVFFGLRTQVSGTKEHGTVPGTVVFDTSAVAIPYANNELPHHRA